jgi:DNA-directed RNA polymerase subunit M/transcription elongation factor TFIIS
MPLAIATVATDIETWLAANTVYCSRYQARLSPVACAQNRALRYDDCRCEGCGGLHDQPPPLPALRLVAPTRHASEDEPDTAPLASTAEVLQYEVVCFDQVGEADETLALLADLGIELAEEQLEALCSELSEETGEPRTEDTLRLDKEALSDRRDRKSRRRKVAVFVGRCHRCGGYMVNDRERQFDETDEEIYRCFSCGWRISPVYAFNRGNPGQTRAKC